MAPICDCGEQLPNDEALAHCVVNNHRRALIRQARAAFEATPRDQRDDAYYEAMAELDRLEAQQPPRPPDAEEVIDLITWIEQAAGRTMASTGNRPTTMIMRSSMATQIRRISQAFPGVFRIGYAPHERPCSIQPPGSKWVGQLSGIDLYEVADG